MSKLCKNCNASVGNAAKVCPKCGASLVEEVIDAGAPLTAEEVTGMSNVDTKAQLKGGVDKVKGAASDFVEKFKNDSKVKNATIAVIAGIVLLIVLKLVLLPSPESILKKYCDGMKSRNADKVISTFNKKMLKVYDEDAEDSDYDDYEELLEEYYDKQKDNDFKIKSFEIDKDYEKLDKDELEEMADYIEDEFDIKASKVKAAREYTVKFKVDNDGDKDTQKIDIGLVKIGMKWYVVGVGYLYAI
ncbi:MAG: hypothetical protein ACI31M_01375 [Bacilli bacterium]